MSNPESVLENAMRKVLFDFAIQTNCYFAFPADHRVKLKGNEKRDKYLDLARELKKNCGTWR